LENWEEGDFFSFSPPLGVDAETFTKPTQHLEIMQIEVCGMKEREWYYFCHS